MADYCPARLLIAGDEFYRRGTVALDGASDRYLPVWRVISISDVSDQQRVFVSMERLVAGKGVTGKVVDVGHYQTATFPAEELMCITNLSREIESVSRSALEEIVNAS